MNKKCQDIFGTQATPGTSASPKSFMLENIFGICWLIIDIEFGDTYDGKRRHKNQIVLFKK